MDRNEVECLHIFSGCDIFNGKKYRSSKPEKFIPDKMKKADCGPHSQVLIPAMKGAEASPRFPKTPLYPMAPLTRFMPLDIMRLFVSFIAATPTPRHTLYIHLDRPL